MSTLPENRPANTPPGERLSWYEREVADDYARIKVYLKDFEQVMEGQTESVTICDVPIDEVTHVGASNVHGSLTLTLYRDNLYLYFMDNELAKFVPPDSPFLKTPGTKFEIPPQDGEIRVSVRVPSAFVTHLDGLADVCVADIPIESLLEEKFNILPQSELWEAGRFLPNLLLDLEQLKLLQIPVDPEALDAQRLLAMVGPL